MIEGVLFADLLRMVVLALFGLTLGETAVIFRQYFKIARATRRLLPLHITGISTGLMMLEFYVAFITVTERLGTPFTWLVVYNLVALGLVYASLVAMRLHITPKARVSKEIDSLLKDPHFTP